MLQLTQHKQLLTPCANCVPFAPRLNRAVGQKAKRAPRKCNGKLYTEQSGGGSTFSVISANPDWLVEFRAQTNHAELSNINSEAVVFIRLRKPSLVNYRQLLRHSGLGMLHEMLLRFIRNTKLKLNWKNLILITIFLMKNIRVPKGFFNQIIIMYDCN